METTDTQPVAADVSQAALRATATTCRGPAGTDGHRTVWGAFVLLAMRFVPPSRKSTRTTPEPKSQASTSSGTMLPGA